MPTQLNNLCQILRLYHAWSTVKAKGSAGGIDGITILEFEKEKEKQILKLADELKAGTWKPQPYLEIEVAKKKNPEETQNFCKSSFFEKINVETAKSCRINALRFLRYVNL